MGPKKSARLSKVVNKLVSAKEMPTPPVEINSFRGVYHFLSNFFKSPFKWNGTEYRTVEHAFQAAKCVDPQERLRILGNNNPVVAKRVGRKVKLRLDWETVKMDLMLELLSLKFEGEMGALLLATGDARLVEGNRWHDNFWGSCQCDKHRDTPGHNHLGKLLEIVRDDLRKLECNKIERIRASPASVLDPV